VERNFPGCRLDLLRIYRLRRREHRGSGSQEPAEGHAQGNPRLPAYLHHTLCARVRHADGAGAV
jgi:hypothetical protein